MASNFVDYVKVFCRSGKGGGGSMHFHRAKYVPKGGPDGGDGGKGGDVIMRGNAQLWTLLHLRYTKHLFAEDGGNGGDALKTGANGKNIYIDVPLGTVAYDAETREHLGEITEDKQEIVIMKGGRGGKGNAFFKTATMQAPKFSQPGEPSQEGWIIIELKLLADVGLVGFPNAGKSTLLSVVSAAKPEIADYPFTTLTPNLGIVPYYDMKSFIMADIPGIIEGASEGKGLGLRFLRHIERNSILLFMVAADSENVKETYDILLKELKKYNPELLDKRRILAISKSDLIDEQQRKDIKKHLPKKVPHIFISSAMGEGIKELKDLIWLSLTTEEE
ncbi:MAG: GTPase ObgE [Bacteroidales bacterium]|nr:GTPase ObgE [Bacteroidales bacterium]MBQ2907833.1 GTPase ObgE [Bacteroidales bacterium]MBQ3595937.1 GTPase ObgE [Bacteroidales bacterium]MBR3914827.1 GTPase ObgE [Bacteroidales bacterium]